MVAIDEGIKVKVGKLQMQSNGRFIAENAVERGLCKVVSDAESGKILGIHLLGSVCSEMIFGAATMIEAELRVKDVRDIIFPHPTVSEVIKDAMIK